MPRFLIFHDGSLAAAGCSSSRSQSDIEPRSPGGDGRPRFLEGERTARETEVARRSRGFLGGTAADPRGSPTTRWARLIRATRT